MQVGKVTRRGKERSSLQIVTRQKKGKKGPWGKEAATGPPSVGGNLLHLFGRRKGKARKRL